MAKSILDGQSALDPYRATCSGLDVRSMGQIAKGHCHKCFQRLGNTIQLELRVTLIYTHDTHVTSCYSTILDLKRNKPERPPRKRTVGKGRWTINECSISYGMKEEQAKVDQHLLLNK